MAPFWGSGPQSLSPTLWTRECPCPQVRKRGNRYKRRRRCDANGKGGPEPLFSLSDLRSAAGTVTAYLGGAFCWRIWRPVPRVVSVDIPAGGGGADGMEKLPDCRRASSSWFNWAAVLPVIADGGCFSLPTLWEARAGRWPGGIAELVSPIDPGAAAAPGGGAGYGRSREELGGRLDIGDEGPGPPGTGWLGPGAPTPGPVRCAQTGAAIASAATIATPCKRCFMSLILRCSSRLAEAYPTLIVLRRGTVGAAQPSLCRPHGSGQNQ